MISPESAWNAREEDFALLVLPDVREGGMFGLQINPLLLACQASARLFLTEKELVGEGPPCLSITPQCKVCATRAASTLLHCCHVSA